MYCPSRFIHVLVFFLCVIAIWWIVTIKLFSIIINSWCLSTSSDRSLDNYNNIYMYWSPLILFTMWLLITTDTWQGNDSLLTNIWLVVGVQTTWLISFHYITKHIVVKFSALVYTVITLVLIYWLFLKTDKISSVSSLIIRT